MPVSPDKSRFTACVVGEATAAEKPIFDAALLSDASMREEAASLTSTANRLAHALKTEPIVVLTPAQRQKVLQAASAPLSAEKSRAFQFKWWGPTVATAGLAALLAFGLFSGTDNPPDQGSLAVQPGIPSIGVNPSAPDSSTSAPPPALPVPAIVHETSPAGIPHLTAPESPPRVESRESIAANPPAAPLPGTPGVTAPVPAPGPAKQISPPRRLQPPTGSLQPSMAGPRVEQP